MNIPKLTQKQLTYCIIGLMLLVVLMFVVRDYQATTYINGQNQIWNNNMEWLADRCGCDLDQEVQEFLNEEVIKRQSNWNTTPGLS